MLFLLQPNMIFVEKLWFHQKVWLMHFYYNKEIF